MSTMSIFKALDKVADAVIELLLVSAVVFAIGTLIGLPAVVYFLPGGPLALKIAVPIIYGTGALIGFRLYRIEKEE